MKEKLLLLLACFFSVTAFAQTTFVPDDALESRLIQLGLDSGPLDDFVLTNNINTLLDFDFGNFIVSDITGLQDFTSLTSLRVDGPIADISAIENLTTLEELTIRDVTDPVLDLTALVNLTFLNISDTSIESIDISNSPNLTDLTVENMPLTSLVFGNNTQLDSAYINLVDLVQLRFAGCSNLRTLYVGNSSQLINLDVSESPLLEAIEFDDNISLPFLDLSTNTSLIDVRGEDNLALETVYIKNGNNTSIGQNFRVRNNPLLSCVEVDDVSWSNTFWSSPTLGFSGFSTNCMPSNDDCAQAVPITLVQPASGTSLNATNSANNPGCQGSGVTILDLWYQFTAPASGSVTMTINAPPLVGKIALYASCSGTTLLACQEEELSVTGLTPNTTYYIQVWLEAATMNRSSTVASPENSSGSFILNVQDTSTLSVDSDVNVTNEIQMFPNPAKDQLHIQSVSNLEQISIYDISGKHVLSRDHLQSDTHTLSVASLASGLYVVQIKTEKAFVLKKLIVH